MRTLLLSIAFVCSATLVWGQSALQDQGVIRAYLDTTQQVLGGSVTLTLDRAFGGSLDPVDSVEGTLLIRTTVDTVQGLQRNEFTYLVLDTGILRFPRYYYEFEETQYMTSPLGVKVNVVPAAQGADRSIDRALANLPFNFWSLLDHYWLHLLATVVILSLLIILVRRLRKSKEVVEQTPEEVAIDWFAEAIEGIKEMRKSRPWDRDPKAFYVSLGDLVRTYLSIQTKLSLTEQTTSESLEMLESKWTKSQLDSYEFILTRADYVKFAKGQVGEQEHQDCLSRAERLIIEFKPNEPTKS